MKSFFRAFTITLLATLIPLITFIIIIHADETTRKIGYDDHSPTFSITDGEITVFNKKIGISNKDEKIERAQSFLTAPVTKLENQLIQMITENLLR